MAKIEPILPKSQKPGRKINALEVTVQYGVIREVRHAQRNAGGQGMPLRVGDIDPSPETHIGVHRM